MAEGGGEREASVGTPTVFISYASQDTAVANAVVAALERGGLKCWIAPRDVVPGTLYADEIVRAINEATAVVLVLSAQALASPHVGKEIERASSKRRRIIALHTDSAPLTRAFEYFLSESQWIEVGPGGIEAASKKLVAAVRRHVETAVATEPRPETVVADNSRPVTHADPHESGTKSAASRRTRLVTTSAFAAVVTVALGYALVDKLWLSKHATAERQSTGTFGAGRFAEAEAPYRKVIELAPAFASTRGALAKTLLAEGKPEAALAMAQQEGSEGDRLDILPMILQALGRQAEADEVLKALITKFSDTDAYYVAMNYAYRDDHDLALQWLERAYEQRESDLVGIVGEAMYKHLANDPRYKAFLRKMNLPE
jgi:TIR domain